MLPRLAQAIESLFGEALRPASGLLRTAAQVALVAAVAFSLVRAARALRAFRLGWENALVVRCPRCRRLVADPALRTCPSGHPIRFPAGAEKRESRRQRFHRLSRVVASSAVAIPALIALASAAGFRLTGVARVEGPLALATASVAYLFLASALALLGLALSGSPAELDRARPARRNRDPLSLPGAPPLAPRARLRAAGAENDRAPLEHPDRALRVVGRTRSPGRRARFGDRRGARGRARARARDRLGRNRAVPRGRPRRSVAGTRRHDCPDLRTLGGAPLAPGRLPPAIEPLALPAPERPNVDRLGAREDPLRLRRRLRSHGRPAVLPRGPLRRTG